MSESGTAGDPGLRPRAAPPLVGRERELSVLTACVERLGEGSGSALLIEGPAGIGKSRLTEAALAAAAEAGWSRAFAGADRWAVRRPFHVALAIAACFEGEGAADADLADLLDAVRRRSEPIALVPPGSARVAVIEAIVGEIERRASEPLLLAVDDLQWTDDASLSALRAVLALTEDRPLLVVTTARPGPGRELDVALRSEIAARGAVLRPGELTADEAVEVTGELLDGGLGPRLRSLVRRAGGNPFAVTELVRNLAVDGRIARADGQVDLIGDDPDGDLAGEEAVRLQALDAGTLELLQPASVLGSPFPLQAVAAVSGRPAASFTGAVADALDAGLLVEEGSELRFAHDLARDAVYEATPPSVRAALHEDAARVLAARGASPVAVATHAALGAAPDQAVVWLRRAAADVMSLSPETALTLLDEALGVGTVDVTVRAAIQRARVESLMGVGRLEDAARLAEQLWPQLSDADARAELLTRLAGLLVLLNRTGEAVSLLERAAHEAEEPTQRALCRAQAALARVAMADVEGAAALAREAAGLAESSGAPAARTIAGSVLGRLPCFTHRYRAGLQPALAAVAAADADRTGRSHDFAPWFWAGLVALDLDDFDLVERALREGRARADDGYATWAHPLYCGLAASAHHRRGDLDEARAEAQTGVSLSVDTGSTQARLWCESVLALVADLRGEHAERDTLVQVAEETWERDNALLGIDHFAVARALAEGEDGAATHLAGAWDLFTDLGMLNCQPLLAVPLTRAVMERDRERAESVAAAVGDAARRSGLAGLEALDQHVRGLLDGSAEELVAAAEGFGRLGRRLDRAEALADAARISARRGDGRAPDLGRAAVEAFERCEAFGAARALAAELGSFERTGKRRALSGWGSLTPTERTVADLVGRGLTNGEIAARRHVSRRTVESHLARVYTKLGYSSRTRLAVEASGRADPDHH